MNKIEIRKALHGWIIAYLIDTRYVEEVYTSAFTLAERVYKLTREMGSC